MQTVTVEHFNEQAKFVRVIWKCDRYEVVGIDGRVLFSSSICRRALRFAEGAEADYAEMDVPTDEGGS